MQTMESQYQKDKNKIFDIIRGAYNMQLKNDKVILRYIKESDIENYLRWATIETEWQNWDAPWEWPDDNYLERVKKTLEMEPNDSRLQIVTLIGEHIGSVNS